jgi:hypothetical protein
MQKNILFVILQNDLVKKKFYKYFTSLLGKMKSILKYFIRNNFKFFLLLS